MSAQLDSSGKKAVEATAVLVVFALFLAVGMYSGQATMTVEIVNPPDGAQFHSSPVELVARVTVKGAPVADVKARFTIRFGKTDETSTDAATDFNGIARLVVPAASGNYTWHVTAIRQGYPTIVSRSGSFSIKLSLLVHGLVPSVSRVESSPVDFKIRVTDMNDDPVASANVTFYVDSKIVGSNLTGANGIARLSSQVDTGMHTWFASAVKNDEGGVSDPTVFLVGELTSLGTGSSRLLRTELRHLCGDGLGIMGIYEPARMSSSSALNE